MDATMVVLIHKNHWVRSVRTATGFRYIDLGTVTNIGTRDQAIARAMELEAREDVAA
jgi:hypothetical protein